MKLRNSLFRMMLCSASTLHLAVDAIIPVSGRTVLPGPGGQTITIQGSQRPWFKATLGSDGTLIDASAGAPVVDPVIGNGALDTAPPAAFNCGRLHWLDPTSRQECFRSQRLGEKTGQKTAPKLLKAPRDRKSVV